MVDSNDGLLQQAARTKDDVIQGGYTTRQRVVRTWHARLRCTLATCFVHALGFIFVHTYMSSHDGNTAAQHLVHLSNNTQHVDFVHCVRQRLFRTLQTRISVQPLADAAVTMLKASCPCGNQSLWELDRVRVLTNCGTSCNSSW